MNEKRIEQVMQIEKQAQQILDAAKQEAARLPAQAEREASEMTERAQAEAQAAAQALLAGSTATDEISKILAESEKRLRDSEEVAARNFNRAVEYVVARILGKA